jgi:predicted deacylase
MMQLNSRTIHGGDGPHLLVIAGVHGDEFEPMVAVRHLWHAFSSMALRGRITLVPIVNEPAFHRAQRTADDGLDLARTMPGRADGSITERVAAALTPMIRDADYLLDLHTGGRLFRMLPLTGYVLHSDRVVLDAQRALANAFNLPIVWGTSSKLEGRTLSVARDANIPAIYVEASGGCEFNSAAVESCVEGCLNVAAMLDMIDRQKAATCVKHVVEDDREGSGHLQVQHPAPMAGFFEPLVQLGDSIRKNQPLGKVLDPFGEPLCEVRADENGIVLFLRAVRGVSAGESLGGILPVKGLS